MTNLHQDSQNNLVSFLRQNQPLPPNVSPQFEQQLFSSLKSHSNHSKQRKLRFKAAWTVPGAIATGFIFTFASFSFKTPRLALEPKDLENFLVKNWHNTLGSQGYTAVEETDADWLLPNTADSKPKLAVSVQ